jgi:hypothetical protein
MNGKIGLTGQAAFATIERVMSQLHPDTDLNCIVFGGIGDKGVGYINFNGVTHGSADVGHAVSGLIAVIESFAVINPELYELFMLAMKAKCEEDSEDITFDEVISTEEISDYLDNDE